MKYLDNAVKNILQPILNNEKFTREKSRYFQRVRGKFLDEIWFQVSQYGSTSFYIHYTCKFVLPNSGKIPLEIGDRYDDSKRKYTWVANNELSAKESMQDVVNLMKINIIPWFDGISTIKDFIIEDCMMNYRTHGGTIIEYLDDKKLDIARINKKCFYKKALKFENINNDTIEEYTAQMIKIATSSLSNKDMSCELEKIDQKIQTVSKNNKVVLGELFQNCQVSCPTVHNLQPTNK